MTDRRMLLVHAHPDDEVINNGVTMARYVAEGAQVTLVTCTLGEEGEILVPELAQLAADQADQLGGYRIGELAAAMGILGVSDHRFLGGPGRYRDSGMMGVPSNEKARAFWGVQLDDAAADLVPVIREVRPQVLITYDENGGYGHPDHIQAHRVAMRGYELASDPDFRPDLGEPWQVQKVYWCATPKSYLRDGIERMQALGQESPFGVVDVEDLPMGTPDELVTTAYNGGGYVEAKMEAMKAHASQITVDGPFFALSNNLGQEVWAVEHYSLVRGEKVGPLDDNGWETDLFAGTS